MFSFEILCTTMHQNDFSKIKEMNIHTDIIFANQCDRTSYEEIKFEKYSAKMISTETRGISKNRNIAIALSSSDYIMFSDDDIRYYDNYRDLIKNEFLEHPEAEAIAFKLKTIAVADNKRPKKNIDLKKTTGFHRPKRREVGGRGVCALVIKRSVLQRKNLRFNENFGSGTEDYCGEDTIFWQELLKKKVDCYISPKIIGDIDKSKTTWFEGFNDKYFFVNGKVLAACYPKLARMLAIRSAYRFSRKKIGKSFFELYSLYIKGIKKFKKQVK